jgi:hypothetical protein
MKVLVILVYAFVNTFGITQPTPDGARKAARILGWVLLAAAILATAVIVLARKYLAGI